jgi:hypothetical protein
MPKAQSIYTKYYAMYNLGELRMPKAGKYEYPFFDFDACLEKLKLFYEKTQSYQTTRSVVADALNMKEKGGGFAYLISSMEKYGLIHTGGGEVTVTELGKILMFGESKEVDQAKIRAVSNVELFREIAQKYGKNPQLEQIKMFLREKANVDIAKAQKIAPSVANIYKKVSNYITNANKLTPPSKEPMQGGPSLGRSDVSAEPEPSKKELLKIQFGEVYIQVPSGVGSLEAIKLAKDALTFMEQRLQEEMKEKKTK